MFFSSLETVVCRVVELPPRGGGGLGMFVTHSQYKTYFSSFLRVLSGVVVVIFLYHMSNFLQLADTQRSDCTMLCSTFP